MGDLLTPEQHAQINAALIDVMNTTHQSSISLFVREISLDLRQIGVGAEYAQYDLKTIVVEKRKMNDEGIEGSMDVNHISTKFHINDFSLLGLISEEGDLLFNSSDSYFIYKDVKFDLTSIIQEDIAVRIEAEKAPLQLGLFKAVFTPLPTEGLVLDLKADRGINGGSPINNDPVALWEDFSGLNNHFTQSVFLDQPLWVESGLDNQPSIVLTAPQFLQLTNTALFTADVASVYLVCQRLGETTSSDGFSHIIFLSGISMFSAGTNFMSFYDVLSSPASGFTDNSFLVDMAVTAFQVVFGTRDFNPNLLACIKSPTQIQGFRNGLFSGNSAGVQTLGGLFHSIGKWFIPSRNRTFEGYISRILCYDKEHTLAEITQTNDALKNEYNIL